MHPLKIALSIAGIFLTKKIRASLGALVPYLEILILNVLAIIIIAFLWTAGILLSLLGLFLYLANVSHFLAPALWTAGACLLIALTMTATGLALMKKMR